LKVVIPEKNQVFVLHIAGVFVNEMSTYSQNIKLVFLQRGNYCAAQRYKTLSGNQQIDFCRDFCVLCLCVCVCVCVCTSVLMWRGTAISGDEEFPNKYRFHRSVILDIFVIYVNILWNSAYIILDFYNSYTKRFHTC